MDPDSAAVRSSPGHWRELEQSYGDSEMHRALGLTLVIEGAGQASVSCPPGAGLTNRSGVVAGAVLAQLVDSAVVQAVRTMLESTDRAVTTELKVNFLRPAQPGTTLTASGRVLDLGRTLAVGSAEVRDASGTLVTVGLATVRVLRAGGSTPGVGAS